MRLLLKKVVETTTCASGWVDRSRQKFAGRTIILAYHNVIPDDAPSTGDSSLHLPVRDFQRQLDHLRDCFEVVGLNEIDQHSPGRPRAVITFDDAYAGAVKHAVPELVRRDLPATFFAVPGFVGGKSFWWDRLACSGLLNDVTRTRALVEFCGKDGEVKAQVEQSPQTQQPVPTTAELEELKTAAALDGITVGSHTWSHPNLERIPTAEFESEIGGAREWLFSTFSESERCDWISYPYGLVRPEAQSAAREAGHRGGLMVAGGYLEPSGDRFSTNRFNVPAGISLEGFKMRVAGLMQA